MLSNKKLKLLLKLLQKYALIKYIRQYPNFEQIVELINFTGENVLYKDGRNNNLKK